MKRSDKRLMEIIRKYKYFYNMNKYHSNMLLKILERLEKTYQTESNHTGIMHDIWMRNFIELIDAIHSMNTLSSITLLRGFIENTVIQLSNVEYKDNPIEVGSLLDFVDIKPEPFSKKYGKTMKEMIIDTMGVKIYKIYKILSAVMHNDKNIVYVPNVYDLSFISLNIFWKYYDKTAEISGYHTDTINNLTISNAITSSQVNFSSKDGIGGMHLERTKEMYNLFDEQ